MCLPGIGRPRTGTKLAGKDPQVKPMRLGGFRSGYALPKAPRSLILIDAYALLVIVAGYKRSLRRLSARAPSAWLVVPELRRMHSRAIRLQQARGLTPRAMGRVAYGRASHGAIYTARLKTYVASASARAMPAAHFRANGFFRTRLVARNTSHSGRPPTHFCSGGSRFENACAGRRSQGLTLARCTTSFAGVRAG